MKRHVSAYLAIIRLQSSTRLNIVVCGGCRDLIIWPKNYIWRYKLHVSRYGGWLALVCGTLGGGHHPWVLSLLVLGGGSGWRISSSECVTCVGLEIRRIDVTCFLRLCLYFFLYELVKSARG